MTARGSNRDLNEVTLHKSTPSMPSDLGAASPQHLMHFSNHMEPISLSHVRLVQIASHGSTHVPKIAPLGTLEVVCAICPEDLVLTWMQAAPVIVRVRELQQRAEALDVQGGSVAHLLVHRWPLPSLVPGRAVPYCIAILDEFLATVRKLIPLYVQKGWPERMLFW